MNTAESDDKEINVMDMSPLKDDIGLKRKIDTPLDFKLSFILHLRASCLGTNRITLPKININRYSVPMIIVFNIQKEPSLHLKLSQRNHSVVIYIRSWCDDGHYGQ
jgi:hypothetical protein